MNIYVYVCVCALHWMDASPPYFVTVFFSSLVGISLKCDAFFVSIVFVFVYATLLLISSGNESNFKKKTHGRLNGVKLDEILVSINHFFY